jgi:HSP20 family molecular chaperone IbpA
MSQNGQSISVAVAPPTSAPAGRGIRTVEPARRLAPARPQTPPIDIHEGPEGLVLEADLPGVTEQAVQIQVEDNVLNLTAETTGPAAAELRVLHQEFASPGQFQRSFILSDEVDRARITAELKDGVLRLSLPKAERVKSRRIEVKGS